LEDFDDGQKFDQFKGKKSTYDESLYTTKIDQSKITAEQKEKAAKYEKEILKQASDGNRHL